MKQYIRLVNKILTSGIIGSDRTGVGTKSIFGHQLKFNLSKGFPIITTKKIFFKGVIHELIWSIKGHTNIKYLNENGVHIWDNWADINGDLGPVYGKQWRKWRSNNLEIDQLSNIIELIKKEPNSRRLIVNSWNVGELDEMAIPPCPLLFQYYVRDNKLSCCVYQRSADVFIGLPFDISFYALLNMIIANICGLKYGELTFFLGDAHIYINHLELVKQQTKRPPFNLPKLKFKKNLRNIDDFRFEDVELINYLSHPKIVGSLAI